MQHLQEVRETRVVRRESAPIRQCPEDVNDGGRENRPQLHLAIAVVQLLQDVLHLCENHRFHWFLAVADVAQVAHDEVTLFRPDGAVHARDTPPDAHASQPDEEVVRAALELFAGEHLAHHLVRADHYCQVAAEFQSQYVCVEIVR